MDREQAHKSWDAWLRHQVHAASLHVPTAAAQKLVLYENNIERQLQRHIKQLERLKKVRMAKKGKKGFFLNKRSHASHLESAV